MKTWMCYEEDGKIKAIETTGGQGQEMTELAKELGLKVLSYTAFNHERDAIHYTELIS